MTMPATLDTAVRQVVMQAVTPMWMQSRIHIYTPDYQPGRKHRRPHPQALCGFYLSHDYTCAPLAEALGWTARTATPTDPRPQWVWCRHCLGHAITLAGLQTQVITLLSRDENTPTADLRR